MARQHNGQRPIRHIMSTCWESRRVLMLSRHETAVKGVLHSTEISLPGPMTPREKSGMESETCMSRK